MLNLVYNQQTNRYGYKSASLSGQGGVNSVSSFKMGNNLVVAAQNVQRYGFNGSENGRVDSDSLNFLNRFSSSMKSLGSSADRLRSLNDASVWNDLQLSNSNPETANVLASGKVLHNAEYSIDVQQLAASQLSSTASVDGSGTGAYVDGSFMLTSGRVDAAGNNLSAEIFIRNMPGWTNEDVQKDIAAQIESQYQVLGIHATTVTDGFGGSQLKLESVDTGSNKGFTIVGGGDKLQLTEQRMAQNLRYAISKDNGNTSEIREYSSNNLVRIDPAISEADVSSNRNILVDFKKTGHLDIKADVNYEKLTKLTEDFVEKYNNTMDMLIDNAHRGTGVSRTLERFSQSPLFKDEMAKIGMDWGNDGKISFDKEQFEKALKDDSRMVYDILADNYSIADVIHQKASNAQNISSNSLLSNNSIGGNQGGSHGGLTIINNYYYNFQAPTPYNYFPGMYGLPIFFNTII